MKITSVDEFVEEKVLPEFHGIVALLRQLMKETVPDAEEMIGYGIPVWKSKKSKRILAVISPTKKDITFAFSRGAKFEDKYGLLEGVGKVSKHVKIKSPQDINKAALRYYLKQALKFDAKPRSNR